MSQVCKRHGTYDCRYATCVIDNRVRGPRPTPQVQRVEPFSYTDPLHPNNVSNPLSPLNRAGDPYGIFGRVDPDDRVSYSDESSYSSPSSSSGSDGGSSSGSSSGCGGGSD